MNDLTHFASPWERKEESQEFLLRAVRYADLSPKHLCHADDLHLWWDMLCLQACARGLPLNGATDHYHTFKYMYAKSYYSWILNEPAKHNLPQTIVWFGSTFCTLCQWCTVLFCTSLCVVSIYYSDIGPIYLLTVCGSCEVFMGNTVDLC